MLASAARGARNFVPFKYIVATQKWQLTSKSVHFVRHTLSLTSLGPNKAVPSCQIARPKPPSDRMVRDRRNASQVARASARATAAAQISFVSRSSLSPRWHAGGCHHSRSRRGGSSLSKGGGRERAPEDDCCRRPFYNTTSPAPCGTVAGSCTSQGVRCACRRKAVCALSRLCPSRA